ncbi:hypothetical protein ACGFNQ_13815 [Streptomyces asoensis]|uniref:hypothetical protein n=1 Tax=Streptomyces asoensis TaxID=249586 RepID=UPI00371A34FB
MSGWITLGIGTAAALCPLPGAGGPAVVVDTTPPTAHVVLCAADGWVEIGASPERGPATPSPSPVRRPPRAPAPATPAPRPVGRPAAPRPPAALPRPPQRPAQRPAPAPRPTPPAVAHEAPAPAAAPPRPAPFRWVPRFHYGSRAARPAPGGLSTMTTTVVITTPAVLAAAALRPGSRRRNGR